MPNKKKMRKMKAKKTAAERNAAAAGVAITVTHPSVTTTDRPLQSVEHQQLRTAMEEAIDDANAFAAGLIEGRIKNIVAVFSHPIPLGPSILPSLCILLGPFLRDAEQSRDSKLHICRVLMARTVTLDKPDDAATTASAATFLEAFLEDFLRLFGTMTAGEIENLGVFLEAGIAPTWIMYHATKHGKKSLCQWLVSEYRVDPFEHDHKTACSPFLLAARKYQVSMLNYFLDLWDEKYEPEIARNGYRNGDGDSPEDLLLRDPHGLIPSYIHVAERYHFEDKVTRLTKDYANARVRDDEGPGTHDD